MNELFNVGDFEALAGLLAADVVFRDLDPPLDSPDSVQGPDRAIDVMRAYRDSLDEFRGEIHTAELSGAYVVCEVTYSAVGPGSGARTTIDSVDRVLVRGGKVAEIVLSFGSTDEALASTSS